VCVEIPIAIGTKIVIPKSGTKKITTKMGLTSAPK
jgi:hypothetical protein